MLICTNKYLHVITFIITLLTHLLYLNPPLNQPTPPNLSLTSPVSHLNSSKCLAIQYEHNKYIVLNYSMLVHSSWGLRPNIILRGRWMLESDWLMNVLRCAIIFRETHGERSSRHRITWPYHFTKWFVLFQRSLQPQTAKEPKPTTTLAKQIKYSKQKDKNYTSFPCFCHKITLYLRKAHTLSLPHRQFEHTLTYALMLLELLWRFDQ